MPACRQVLNVITSSSASRGMGPLIADPGPASCPSLLSALRAGRGLTGMIGLNQGIVSNAAAPFGGAKHSGFGREGGREGIEEYLECKYMAIAR